jgi:hypothetical protein
VLFQGCPDLIGRQGNDISVGVHDRRPGFMQPALISAPVHCHQPGSVGPLPPEYQRRLGRIAIPAKRMKSGPKVTPFFARHGIAKPRYFGPRTGVNNSKSGGRELRGGIVGPDD